jgi:glycosyltransferase involved in cell wall biosynthesis
MSAGAASDQVNLILNVDAITPPLTGIGRYALRLAQGLRGHANIGDARYFSAYKWVVDPEQALNANRGVAGLRRFVPAKSLAMQVYFAVRQRAFDHLARKFGDYVLHSPNYLLFEHSGPRVCTVHDLSWLHYPDYHPKERVQIMEKRMPHSLKIADAVITDSQFVRRELIERFAIDPARVHAIPLGVDDTFAPRDARLTQPAMTALGLRHDGYLLALATLEPRKNLGRLLDAYEQLDAALRKRYPLVLAGATGWHANALVERIDALVARGEALRLGFVPENLLPQLVAGARLLAFPSIYEGFGLPPLEAMASGVPVVASAASCIPEVTGNAALLVSPEDVDGLKLALERGLTDAPWRAQAITHGLDRARQFTWQACVDATVQIYRQVAASSRAMHPAKVNS